MITAVEHAVIRENTLRGTTSPGLHRKQDWKLSLKDCGFIREYSPREEEGERGRKP